MNQIEGRVGSSLVADFNKLSNGFARIQHAHSPFTLFDAPSFVFSERMFFCRSARSARQRSRKRYARIDGGGLPLLTPACLRTRFVRVIGGRFSAQALIGQ